jgi:hypothetical protein
MEEIAIAVLNGRLSLRIVQSEKESRQAADVDAPSSQASIHPNRYNLSLRYPAFIPFT